MPYLEKKNLSSAKTFLKYELWKGNEICFFSYLKGYFIFKTNFWSSHGCEEWVHHKKQKRGIFFNLFLKSLVWEIQLDVTQLSKYRKPEYLFNIQGFKQPSDRSKNLQKE